MQDDDSGVAERREPLPPGSGEVAQGALASLCRREGIGLWIGALLLAVGLMLLASVAGELHSELVIDDAYITYRYASNWADGVGPTWNRGEAPIEGYTTPLYMTVLAASASLGADVAAASKLLGLACALGLILVVALLTYRATGGVTWAFVAAGVLAAHPYLGVHAVSGMETVPYALLATIALLMVQQTAAGGGRWAWIGLGAALAALALMRTEGFVFTIAFGAVALVDRAGRWPRRGSIAVVATVAAIFGAHLLVRRLYYGLWMPLPVYEKGELWANAALVREFFGTHWPLLLLWLPAVGMRGVPNRATLLYGLASVAALIAVVVHVQPVMNIFDRHQFVVVPTLVFGAALGLREVMRGRRDVVIAAGFVALVAVALGPHLLWSARADAIRKVHAYSERMDDGHIALALWVRENVADPDVLMAVADCGVIPYLSGVRVIDTFGLNDPHIAQHGVDADYIFGRNPELIVISSLERDEAVRSDARLRQRYTPIAEWVGFYPLTLLRRNDYTPGAGPAGELRSP